VPLFSTYCTVDAVCVNLFSTCIRFLKSFVIHNRFLPCENG
jgi:hypothetical protein